MRYTLSNRRALDPFFGLRTLDTLLNAEMARATAPTAWAPAVDVVETADAWQLVAELPGIAPEQVKLTVENRVLSLAGEKPSPHGADSAARTERRFGSFARNFTLPETADAERITASSTHGLLTITVPKAPQVKPREIVVQVASAG